MSFAGHKGTTTYSRSYSTTSYRELYEYGLTDKIEKMLLRTNRQKEVNDNNNIKNSAQMIFFVEIHPIEGDLIKHVYDVIKGVPNE